MIAAVLLTCFNRREKTLACLRSIYGQLEVEGVTLKIFLVDDGSVDGTSNAVITAFPEVNVLRGDGSLYWNGGMNKAWKAALREGFDYYIWVNDDVSLVEGAFLELFESFHAGYTECGTESVVVGCFHETDGNSLAYGGFHIRKTLLGMTAKRMHPEGVIKRCDTFNGNLVLIPDSAAKEVGLLDERYTHAFGDQDYGFRCMKKGIPMYITPEYLGECARNNVEGSCFDPSVSLKERYQKLILPTGIPPKEYFYFVKNNCNSFAGGVALLKLFLRLLFPKLWLRLSRR